MEAQLTLSVSASGAHGVTGWGHSLECQVGLLRGIGSRTRGFELGYREREGVSTSVPLLQTLVQSYQGPCACRIASTADSPPSLDT